MRVAITFTLMAALAHWLLSPEGVEAVATLTLFLAILWRMKVIYGHENEDIYSGDGCNDRQTDGQDI